MSQIRVLLVDDHALVRESLSDLLRREVSLEVVGAAASAEQAIELVRQARPDVVLMDVDMPGLTCFDAVRMMQSLAPAARFIILSAHMHDRYIEQALNVGALGYVTKHEPAEQVIRAIQAVAAGRCWYSEQVRSRIIFDNNQTRLAPAGKSRSSSLTPRETEVLAYLARGLAKKEIARIMSLSLKTVENHTDHLMHKLDIHDRVELTRFAIREGLVEA